MKRFLALLLLTATVLTTFAGCKSNPSEDTQSGDTTAPVTERDYSIPLDDELIVARDKKSEYTIFVNTDNRSESLELQAATALRELILEVSGVRLKILTASEDNVSDCEILFGPTVRENEYFDAERRLLDDGEYRVKVFDKRIVFIANDEEGYWQAVDDFARTCMRYDVRTANGDPERVGYLYVSNSLDLHNGIVDSAAGAVSVNGVDLASYAIVAKDTFSAASTYLSTALETMTGKEPDIIFRPEKKSAEYEIVIGDSARDDVFGFDYASLNEGECKVAAYPGKLAFLTKDAASALAAVKRFLKEEFGYVESVSAPTGVVAFTLEQGKQLSYTASGSASFEYTAVGDTGYSIVMQNKIASYVGNSDGKPMCFSNAYNKVIERVELDAKNKLAQVNDGEQVVLNLAFNSSDEVCTCAACTAAMTEEGTHMGAYFKLIRQVAEKLAVSYPEVKISIIAYNATAEAPKTQLPENVIVYFVEWGCCSNHAINDASCATNHAVAERLSKWTTAAKTLYVLDMTSDYFYFPVFFPNFMTVRQNVNYYSQIGVKGVALQFDTTLSSLEFGETREKLYTELLKNPAVSEEDYLQEIKVALAKVYDAENVENLASFIQLMCNNRTKDCFTVFDRGNVTVPISRSVDENGKTTYDLTVAIEAYRLWEQIHPYGAYATSELVLAQKLYNVYQRKPESFTNACFTEWLTANIDYQDKAWVLNEMYDALGIAHN